MQTVVFEKWRFINQAPHANDPERRVETHPILGPTQGSLSALSAHDLDWSCTDTRSYIVFCQCCLNACQNDALAEKCPPQTTPTSPAREPPSTRVDVITIITLMRRQSSATISRTILTERATNQKLSQYTYVCVYVLYCMWNGAGGRYANVIASMARNTLLVRVLFIALSSNSTRDWVCVCVSFPLFRISACYGRRWHTSERKTFGKILLGHVVWKSNSVSIHFAMQTLSFNRCLIP